MCAGRGILFSRRTRSTPMLWTSSASAPEAAGAARGSPRGGARVGPGGRGGGEPLGGTGKGLPVASLEVDQDQFDDRLERFEDAHSRRGDGLELGHVAVVQQGA